MIAMHLEHCEARLMDSLGQVVTVFDHTGNEVLTGTLAYVPVPVPVFQVWGNDNRARVQFSLSMVRYVGAVRIGLCGPDIFIEA